MTSSVPDGSTLKGAIAWSAQVTDLANVTMVNFSIDDKVVWVERTAPYDFDDATGRLSTWLLINGPHTLTATAVESDGTKSIATSHVTVMNDGPAVDPALRGAWARTTSPADTYRVRGEPGYDPSSANDYNGIWTFTFRSDGLLKIGDPKRGGVDYQVNTGPGHVLQAIGPANWTLPQPVTSSPLYGDFCEDTQRGPDKFTWRVREDYLVISGGSACADRDSVWRGTWTRVS